MLCSFHWCLTFSICPPPRASTRFDLTRSACGRSGRRGRQLEKGCPPCAMKRSKVGVNVLFCQVNSFHFYTTRNKRLNCVHQNRCPQTNTKRLPSEHAKTLKTSSVCQAKRARLGLKEAPNANFRPEADATAGKRESDPVD